MAKLISKTYGEALFELAVEEEKTDVMLKEIEGMKNVLLDNPEYLKFLNHPRISGEESLTQVDEVELVLLLLLKLLKGGSGVVWSSGGELE